MKGDQIVIENAKDNESDWNLFILSMGLAIVWELFSKQKKLNKYDCSICFHLYHSFEYPKSFYFSLLVCLLFLLKLNDYRDLTFGMDLSLINSKKK